MRAIKISFLIDEKLRKQRYAEDVDYGRYQRYMVLPCDSHYADVMELSEFRSDGNLVMDCSSILNDYSESSDGTLIHACSYPKIWSKMPTVLELVEDYREREEDRKRTLERNILSYEMELSSRWTITKFWRKFLKFLSG